MAAVPPKDENDLNEKDSRERLLRAAQSVFSQKGFDGATVKDLADQAQVNVSLVSYYFGGKEGLYRACLEDIGRDRLSIAGKILNGPTSLEDMRTRLRLFLEEFFSFHMNNPEISRMIQHTCDSATGPAVDIFKGTFLKAYGLLESFFKHAQKLKIIKKEVDVQTMTFVFFGSLVSVVRFENVSHAFFDLSLKESKFRERVITHLLDHFLKGFFAEV